MIVDDHENKPVSKKNSNELDLKNEEADRFGNAINNKKYMIK